MGSFCHDLVERVAKGEISQEMALSEYDKGFFQAIEQPFPATPYWKDPEGSYYKKIRPWFEREKWWDGEVHSAEEHLVFDLPSGDKFQSYVDRINKHDIGFRITDYKVAKKYTGEELEKKSRQLHMYAYGFHQKYGEYPSEMEFEYFQFSKAGRYVKPSIVKFNYDDMVKTIDWAEEQIDLLKNKIKISETEKGHFLPDYNNLQEVNGMRGYYCMNICTFRENCPFVEGLNFKQF